jgi:hypothetical protein
MCALLLFKVLSPCWLLSWDYLGVAHLCHGGADQACCLKARVVFASVCWGLDKQLYVRFVR